MAKVKTNTIMSAVAFLNYARQYNAAAVALFDSNPQLSDPINSLYFHTVELALKAYLRMHGRNPWGHDIENLFNECCTLGLKISSDNQSGLWSIVSLLAGGNEDMAFRYFSLKGGGAPDLKWTREAVGQLVQAVAAFVEPNGPTPPGPPVKIRFVVGKPRPA